MKQKVTPVLIPIEKESNILKLIYDDEIYWSDIPIVKIRDFEPQQLLILSDDAISSWEKKDYFLWRSSSGEFETHQYHSDAGYGIKTLSMWSIVDGSSLLVNHSGVCGKIIAAYPSKEGLLPIHPYFIQQYVKANGKCDVWCEMELSNTGLINQDKTSKFQPQLQDGFICLSLEGEEWKKECADEIKSDINIGNYIPIHPKKHN